MLRTLIVVLVVMVLLAGCSNGSDDGLAVGDNAPDFSLPEASGSIVSLDDYTGEPVLLYFHMADG
jgi:cytochrome oxidase Cu insertion factor (SCO1/SenC/PrrC family)